jgi:hypothetical protein
MAGTTVALGAAVGAAVGGGGVVGVVAGAAQAVSANAKPASVRAGDTCG